LPESEELLEAVRTASLPGLWSEGVKLAREGRVAEAARSPSEVTLRVRAPGRVVAPTVTLYMDEKEWSCDCGGKVDPCAHVAAAVIYAARGDVRTDASGESPSRAEGAGGEPARLVYRMSKKDRVLILRRFIVFGDGREAAVLTSLSSDIARRKLPEAFAPTHDDLRVDRLLGTPPREVVPLAAIGDLFTSLSSDAEVTFQGEPVRVSGDALRPVTIIEDAPLGGFILRMEQDAAITEVVAMGVARCGDTLRPIAEGATTGQLLERLPLSRTYVGSDEAKLVTEVLPELEKRLLVSIRTRKLPGTQKEARPRIAMDYGHQGHTLSVLPLLVYGDPPIARVDGDSVVALGKDVPVRRPEEERALLTRLRDELNLVPGRRVDLDGSDAVRFGVKLREWQRRNGEKSRATPFEERALVPRLDLTDGRFDVIFECEPEKREDGEEGPKRRADTAAVLRAWRDGLTLVPIDGGGWAPLPEAWLLEHGHRVMDLLAARDAELKIPTAALPALGELCEALDEPKPLELARLAPLLDGFTRIPRATLPKNLLATLRGYQEAGVDWLSFLRSAGLGAVLADDMGLGKTLETICVLAGPTLVVCPKSVVYNWADELARFRPSLRTAIYHGPKRQLSADADVTLTTYAVLRLDVDLLAAHAWDAIVLDEAQAIKNATSQTARAAFALKGAFRVALSGTPVENRLEELWSLMHFANPGLLGGRSDFQERYAEPIASGNGDAAARLRAKIRPFVLRRMKREVAPELPLRTDMVLHVELDETERAVYDAVRVATKKDVAEKLAKGGGVLVALEALLRLRQAACHSELVPGQHAETSSKIERLLEALEEAAADGHKALVFSQWTSLLDLVEPHLSNAQIRFTRLDGKTRDRASVVSAFQSEEGPPVMLVSLKAGGTGLNLTAADHVFLLDPWWNPAVEDQAADRAHRIGQNRPVMVYRMVAKDTVEEKISVLQAKKRGLADAALGNADQAAAITREELLALLD
jgi:superfamily II DNA or RNA helicase